MRNSCLCLLVFGLSLGATQVRPRIVPLQTTATFSSEYRGQHWSAPIKSVDGTTMYVLSLEPDFDIGRHVVTVEIVLRRPGDKDDQVNLLDPTGMRHGLQPYDFAAIDLAHGAENSAFGEKRTVSLKNIALTVVLDVLKSTVSPISGGKYKLDGLQLRIGVNNFNR